MSVKTPPFPSRYAKVNKDAKIRDIFETLRKVEINIPLLDAVKQIPSFAKFLKDFCTQNRKFVDYKKVALTQEVSAVLLRKLPPKLKDPGSFTIPCKVGSLFFEKALLDLGVSINLLPYAVYEILGLGELQPISITLELADRSVKRPRGILEDVLVTVNNTILPADFVVLDTEDGTMPSTLPIILGHPFMSTANMKICVKKGTISMKVNGEKLEFKVFDAMKKANELPDDYFSIDVIHDHMDKVFQDSSEDALETVIAGRHFLVA